MNAYKLPRIKKESKSGIYFLLDLGTIVYIGKSKNVVRRTTEHDNKIWDEYSYILCQERHLDKEEKKYIQTYSPKYNKALAYTKVVPKDFNYELNYLDNEQAVLDNNQFHFRVKDVIKTLNLVYNHENYQFQGHKGYIRMKEKYGEIEILNKQYFIVPENNILKLQSKN